MNKLSVKDNSAYLITDKFERRYFSEVSLEEGYLLVAKRSVYFTDARYYSMLFDKLKGEISPKLFTGYNDIKEYLKENSITKLFIDYDKTTLTEYEMYKDFGVEIFDGKEEINSLKAVKSQKEIDLIKKSCEITEKTYYSVIDKVKEGITETEVAKLIKDTFLELGAEDLSFNTIVAFGGNSAIPHHETGNTKLKKDMPILIDMGCIYKGYASDFTRTAFFGKPTEKFLHAYESVLTANLLAEDKIALGMTNKDCDNVARSYFESKGLKDKFTHSLGHGLGLQIHENPYLSPKGRGKLENNMVFTIEPGLYFDGEFGIRIEDTVALINGRVERFFKDDKKLKII